MEFSLDFKSMSSSFPIPCDVADKYIKLASGEQLKVLLLVMRDLSNKISAKDIAEKIGISEISAEDALLFWVRCGILKKENSEPEKKDKNIMISAELPTREDVIARGMEDDKIRLLLREAQLKFGRNLKNNESRLLVSLYDDYGMDVSVILLLLQHAVAENKANLSNIRSIAVKWIKADVRSVRDGEKMIADEARGKLAFSVVRKTFGIEQRLPSEKEIFLSNLWVNEWGMSAEMLKAAYDACVDQKAKVSFAYIGKILEKWHSAGYQTKEDIKVDNNNRAAKRQSVANDFAGFDLDAFEAKLNSD
ncbi:MAG: DnaD domain protein [Clostridia bacterium]|nr:DnaD domain protein [Clostridia bacterium]